MDKHDYNNKVSVIGIVSTEPQYLYNSYKKDFYTFKLQIPRLSTNTDTVNVTISEAFFTAYRPEIGDHVMIKGQFRSYNIRSETGMKLVLTVFVKDLVKVGSYADMQNATNIYLNGFICNPPVYRRTPLQREITDILLAVNRSYNKSDYIPCIAWGRNAMLAGQLAVGTNICVWGRIQSREYQKLIENKVETKTAYEVSISKIDISYKKYYN